MPALGMQQDSGKLITWLKAEGEFVERGEPVMEIETDKATVEIEAPASGILGGIVAEAGDVIPVGQTVAWILLPGESAPKPDREDHPQPVSASPIARRMAGEYGVDLTQIKPEGGRIRKDDVLRYMESMTRDGKPRLQPASPKARRLAGESGLDLERLRGSGPGGAVLAADVGAAAPTTAISLPKTDLFEPDIQAFDPGTVWQVMARRVTESWTSTPHFCLVREVEASRLIAWRKQAQPQIEVQLTYTDILVKLAAAALSCHPRVNASWREGRIAQYTEINVGLAAAVQDGLVVPVIHRANEQSLEQIAERRQDLVRRAQAGRLRSEDLANGTFTISNLGMFGVDAFSAIVNPPQAAILAVGRIADRVVPIDGEPAVRPMMILSLSFDHRVVDGALGARFLNTLARLVEEPLLLME